MLSAAAGNKPDGGKGLRDDFSRKTKGMLAKRVANVCSNPSCRVRTIGPDEGGAGAINIGVAAHIAAASGGGPRYDPFMTLEERSGIDNGIWLCQNCAHLIDADSAAYPVELLHRWKEQAESEARASLGKRCSLSETEAQVLSEAEELAEEALGYLRFVVRKDETHLIREVVLLPNRNVIFGPLGGPRHEIYYEDLPTLILQFRWLEEQGLINRMNDSAIALLYRIPNNVYRWLQLTA